jgi:hypothetical protein
MADGATKTERVPGGVRLTVWPTSRMTRSSSHVSAA